MKNLTFGSRLNLTAQSLGIMVLSFQLSGCSELDYSAPKFSVQDTDTGRPEQLFVRTSSFSSDESGLIKINAKTVVFEDETSIQTFGRELVIEADEIISRNGSITTFPDSSEAGQGQVGRSAGHILIRANRLIGNLSITMRGERGGKGGKGGPGNRGSTGSVGPRTTRLAVLDYCPPTLDYGMKQVGTSYVNGHPGRGGVGGSGSQGTPGLSGFIGGDSGFLEIEIQGLSSKQISITSIPGKGGKGGDGGDGGRGGDGGLGGSIDDNHVCDEGRRDCCPAPPSGPEGEPGLPGDVGPFGDDGLKGRVLINENEVAQ